MNIPRCPNCGAPAGAGAGECRVCGATLTAPAPSPPVAPTPGSPPAPGSGSASTVAPSSAAGVPAAPAGTAPTGRHDLEGTVLSISETRYEPADFNGYRFFSLLLIILGLLPLVLLYIAFRIAFAIVLRMLGFRPGISFFGHFFWIWVGRGAHGGGREEPVMHVVVRTSAGEQRTVRIKGHLVRGSLQSGDRIAVNGRWDGGTLLFRNGRNLTTGSVLRLRPNYWKPVFFILLAAAVALVVYAANQPL